MTVIAAIVTPEGAWLGGDSLSSDGDLCVTTTSPKVVKFQNFLLGSAGDWAAAQTFFNLARANRDLSLRRLLATARPKSRGWTLLAVERGRIYEIDDDKGVVRMPVNRGYSYTAIGSGAGVALGALFVDHYDRAALLVALQAAAKHSSNIRRPFRIVTADE